ncbi:MAG: hypothetical protein KDK99_11365, partial [Verrucomicrobiales bacterium]|nr:hypothetical protein [Verrucomicrobiales bacterium]
IGIGLLAILASFGLGLASWQGSARGSITGWIFAILLAVLWIRLAISAWRSTRGETARDIRPLFALGRHALLLLGLAAAIALPGFYQFKSTRDELRPFAAELQRHIGPTDPIVLYKLKERMWPFYLGLRCREIASLGDLPQTTRWVMVEADKAPQRQIEMERRYGPLQEAVAIQEPDTDNAGGNGTRYTLFRFGSAP